MTVYKADLKTNFYYILGFIILFGVTLPLSLKFPGSAWLFLVAFLLIFLLYNLFTSRLSEIRINKTKDELSLIYKNYLGIKKAKNHDLSNTKFTYKQQKTSLRGGIKNVCSLYTYDKQVVQIAPDEDGWGDDEIFSLVHGLIDAGIERKFVGYSLKDVPL